MRNIIHNGNIVACVFDTELENGSVPLTSPELPLQVVGLNHPKGKVWPLHIHAPKERKTTYALEVFFVLEGRARIQIFKEKEKIASLELKKSEGIMILEGAMEVEVLEDIKVLEFKNGPFIEDKIILKREE